MNKLITISKFSTLFSKGNTVTASVSDSLSIKVDTATIVKKKFAEGFSEPYSGKEYDYDAMEGEAENFIGRAINWFFNKMGEIFGFELTPELFEIIKFIVYAILIVFAIYILVKFLVGNNASSFFTQKSKMVSPLNIQEEHIENIDLDSYIKDALKEENYRLAIRYMYLKALKQLSIFNIIDWHFEKTNTDYLKEIENEQLKSSFKKVSYIYDNIWYGEFALNKDEFLNANKEFERLNNNLKNAG